jgi:hypothetical protein
VSFYERDMADPATYRELYDVVLAFSAFRFIADHLDRLAAITEVLVVETHELKGNFDERYLVPLTEHFPAFRMLGESEVERLRAGGVRAVGVFARDESALLGALAPALRAGGRAAGVLAAGVRGQRIRGAVDELQLDGEHLRISGWCRHPVTPHDAVELSTPADGTAGAPFGTLAVAEPSADGGFEIECEAPLADSSLARLDVSAFSENTPLGSMSAYWSPGLTRDQLLSLTVAHDLLEPVGRYRALDAFESALDLDSDSNLEPFRPSLVPNARWSSWNDDVFDLVIGHAVDVDEGRVAELHRVSRPGAYLALSVLGELARRFGEPGLGRDDLIGLCAQRFDVMTYVEGGVGGLHDLIVLRRP